MYNHFIKKDKNSSSLRSSLLRDTVWFVINFFSPTTMSLNYEDVNKYYTQNESVTKKKKKKSFIIL